MSSLSFIQICCFLYQQGSSSVSLWSGDVSMTMSAVGAVSVVSASTGLATRH